MRRPSRCWSSRARITTPSSVSPQAQAAIAAGSAAVPQRLAEPEAFPSLDDVDAWKARIAAMDEFDRPRVRWSGLRRDHGEDPGRRGRRVRDHPDRGRHRADAPLLLRHPRRRADRRRGRGVSPDGDDAAARTGLHTWAVDYRMPPDHPYPTPLDDCVAVYRALLEASVRSRSWSAVGRPGQPRGRARCCGPAPRVCRCRRALAAHHSRGGSHRVGRHVRRRTRASTTSCSSGSRSRSRCTPATTISRDPFLSPLFGD